MREFEVRPSKTAFIWAFGAFFINVITVYILHLIGVDKESPINYLSYIPFVLGLILCIRYHKMTDLDGYISYWRAFGVGFRFTSMLALLMGVFMYIYLKWLNVAVFEEGLVQAENQMIDQGTSADKIEVAIDLASNWGPFFAAITTSFMYTLTGVALSLLFAAVLKNEEPMFAQNEENE